MLGAVKKKKKQTEIQPNICLFNKFSPMKLLSL